MHEAFWDGLSGVRWEEAPLGPEAIRLVQSPEAARARLCRADVPGLRARRRSPRQVPVRRAGKRPGSR